MGYMKRNWRWHIARTMRHLMAGDESLGVSMPLAKNTTYATPDESVARKIAAIPDLYNFAYDCATNYDHDDAAHRYGHTCQKCEAERIIAMADGLIPPPVS